jgi:hypothetical protein
MMSELGRFYDWHVHGIRLAREYTCSLFINPPFKKKSEFRF